MKSSIYTFFIFLFLLPSCKESNTIINGQKNQVELNREFIFKIGDIACLETEESSLSFTFTSIIEDSRCPTNAICVWEGKFTALFTCSGCTNDTFTLGNNASNNPSTRSQNGYLIELLEISPTVTLNKTIDVNDYQLTLIIRNN